MIRRWVILTVYVIGAVSLTVQPVVVSAAEQPDVAQTAPIDSSSPSNLLQVVEEQKPVPVVVPIESTSATDHRSEILAVQTPVSKLTEEPTPAPIVVTEPISTISQPLPIPMSQAVVVSSLKMTAGYGYDFIELHNTADSMSSVEGVSLHLLYSTTVADFECTIKLSGYIRPSSFVTFSTRTDANGAYTVSGCPVPEAPLLDQEIQVYRGNDLLESVLIPAASLVGVSTRQWERGGWTATYRTGIFTKDFKALSLQREAYTSSIYTPPPAPNLQFLEVFPRPLLCSSGDASPVCRPYIKLKNTGTEVIDLSQFRLRSGLITQTSSKYNTSQLASIIAPGSFITLGESASGQPLAINAADGATWLEDVFGLQTYANNDSPYHDADLVAQSGKSWALDSSDRLWKWGIPSPFSELNIFDMPGKGSIASPKTSSLQPCADNQYRSEETNRCRLISTSSSGLTPCKEGQYRSEETNRCRSIALAASAVLKPCADDQFRNPASGRCKKIASTDDLVQPCAEGKERNPLTNRCRNILSDTVTPAAFAVDPVKDGIKSFVGWWALGIIGIVAAGYGVWEWRYEILHGIRRVNPFSTRDK